MFYTNNELNATKNNELNDELILEDKLDMCEEFGTTDSQTPCEYWSAMALYGFLSRLPLKYREREEVKKASTNLAWCTDKFNDWQIKEAIALFNPDEWKSQVKEVTEDWLENKIPDEDFAEYCQNFLINLDDWGMVLAFARDKGIVSAMESPEWDAFDSCTDYLMENETLLKFMSNYVQSLACLVDEDIYEINESLYLTSSYLGECLKWLYADQQVDENHPEYVQFVKDKMVRMFKTALC